MLTRMESAPEIGQDIAGRLGVTKQTVHGKHGKHGKRIGSR